MNKNTQMALKVLVITSVVLFIVVLLIKRFKYFEPSSLLVETREKYQEIQHRGLHARLLDNPGSERVALFCHGNSGNISHMENTIRSLRDIGLSVLAFDYSGYGKSRGVPSEQQLYSDACSMVALLLGKYSAKDIVVYGESMGGPVATYVALRYGIPYLILNAPLPSVSKIIASRYPYLAWLGFLFPEFDTAKYLSFYTGKTLLLHSPDDEIIAYDSVKELCKMCTDHVMIQGLHIEGPLPLDHIRSFIGTWGMPGNPGPVERKRVSPSPLHKKGEDFIAADKFEGPRPGFVFKKDEKGLGYYRDRNLLGSDGTSQLDF